MSRSPYDPAPSYTTCSHCSQEYDGSGYYGTDDEAHYCKDKLRVTLRFLLLRFPDLEYTIREVQDAMVEEARQQEIKRRQEQQERLRARREAVVRELAEIDSELQEFGK